MTARFVSLRLALLLAALMGLACFAQSANAAPYKIGGHRWPSRTITYYDATQGVNYHKGVKLAIAAWNSRGLNVRFQPVASVRRANFVIRIDRSIAYNSGYASIGYAGRGWPYAVQLNMPPANWASIALVTSHELGHILGLDHASGGCEAMTPIAFGGCNVYAKPGYWYCRLQEKGDLAGAKRLYGGHPRLQSIRYCLISPLPGPVTGATATAAGAATSSFSGAVATVNWNAAKGAKSYHITRSAAGGTCVTSISGGDATFISQTMSLTDDTIQPGAVYCYTIWPENPEGLINPAGAATVSVSYTAPPVPDPVGVSVANVSDGYGGWQISINWPGQSSATRLAYANTCTLTDPISAYGSVIAGSPANDYVDGYDGTHTSGSHACYRFWAVRQDGSGTTYSAHWVDVPTTLS